MTVLPANVLIIPYPNFFLRASPDGAPDLGVSRQLLLAFVSSMREARLHHVLIDLRPVAPTLLLENRRWQPGVAGDAQSPSAEERVALLVPRDEHDHALFFGDIERVAGAYIQIFTDFEAAMGWLILQEQPAI